MRVTDEGRGTIPKAPHDRLDIRPGSQVDCVAIDDHLEVHLSEGQPSHGDRLVRSLWGAAGPGMSTDELMALTRAED